ncbi:hypothetical protein KKA13_02710 [Patescibacteria group bacterium]|nr:hypothetical protein [Patescibacteria group bacterium]
MKKIIVFLGAIFLGITGFAGSANAVCPVCTIAVGAGVGFSRYLGIDDTISGVWIGGLTVSLIMWTINWFKKKSINFKYREAITAIGYYLLIVAPLHYIDIIGHPLNKICGIDKILVGVFVGSVFFFGFERLYIYLKKKNGDKAHFPFEKVVLPVSPLVAWSIIFYFLTK